MKQYSKFYLVFLILSAAFIVTSPAAFAQKAKLTTHREMVNQLTSLQSIDSLHGYNRLNVVSIGKSVRGKDILMAVIADPSIPTDDTKRLFVICRQHGDEPAPTEAMLKLINDLVLGHDSSTESVLEKVSFYIVPMMNPDGADLNRRRNSNGVDLNRDWIELSQPETRAVSSAILTVAPYVIIDQHELSPNNRTEDFIETAGTGSGVCPDLIRSSDNLHRLIVGMLRTHDIRVRTTKIADDNRARLAHRYYPVHEGIKTMLFETRQSHERQYMLQQRMRTHIIGTMTTAKFLAGEEEHLRYRIAMHDNRGKVTHLASRGGKDPSEGKEKDSEEVAEND